MELPLPQGNPSLAYHSNEAHDGMKSEAHEDAPISGIYEHRHWEHLSRSQRALGRRLLAEGIQPSTIVAEFGWSTSTVYKLKNDQYNEKDLESADLECIDAHAGAILRKLVDSNDARPHRPWQHLAHADHARCRFLLGHGVKPRALSAETGWSASTIDKIKHDKHIKKIYDKTQDFKYIDAATWAMLRKLEVQGAVKTKGKTSRVRKSKHDPSHKPKREPACSCSKNQYCNEHPGHVMSPLCKALETRQCSPRDLSDAKDKTHLSVVDAALKSGLSAFDTHLNRLLRKYMLEGDVFTAPFRDVSISATDLEELVAQPEGTLGRFVAAKFPTLNDLSLHIVEEAVVALINVC